MKKIPAGVASSVSAVEPLVATLIGVVLYGEPMTVASYIGMVFIVTSVVLLSLHKD